MFLEKKIYPSWKGFITTCQPRALVEKFLNFSSKLNKNVYVKKIKCVELLAFF